VLNRHAGMLALPVLGSNHQALIPQDITRLSHPLPSVGGSLQQSEMMGPELIIGNDGGLCARTR
jgi:hypothetical protein